MSARTALGLFAGVGIAVLCVCCISTDGFTGRPAELDGGPEGGPSADGSLDASVGCDANLGSDPANCGRCGHDCLGGACEAGACGPALVGIAVARPYYIALDADYVYIGSRGVGVVRVEKKGGFPRLLYPSQSAHEVIGITVDETHVYWVETLVFSTADLFSAPKDGSGPVLKVAADAGSLLEVAVDESAIFATDFRGAVRRYDRTGVVQAALTTTTRAEGLAIDDASVVWTEQRSGGQVITATKALTNANVLAANLGGPRRLAIDAEYAYWIERDTGRVMRTLRTAPVTPEQIGATAANTESNLAVDERDVYWCDQATGSLVRWSKASKVTTTLVTGILVPTGMALDDRAVYFVAGDAGTVSKIAK